MPNELFKLVFDHNNLPKIRIYHCKSAHEDILCEILPGFVGEVFSEVFALKGVNICKAYTGISKYQKKYIPYIAGIDYQHDKAYDGYFDDHQHLHPHLTERGGTILQLLWNHITNLANSLHRSQLTQDCSYSDKKCATWLV